MYALRDFVNLRHVFCYTKYMPDVIIVLGRGINDDGTLPPDPQSRVRKAVELYNNKLAPRIIMSGAWSFHSEHNPTISEATSMKKYAIELGVPEASVIEESESKDTIGNVYYTKKNICIPQGFRDIIVVASDEHMPRIEYLFRKIYGSDYILTFTESERVLSDSDYEKEVAHENKSMKITKQLLDPITDGDHQELWSLVVSQHPAYK